MTLNKTFFAMVGAFLAMSATAISLVVAATVESAATSASAVALAFAVVAAFLLYGQARNDLDAVLTLVAVFSLFTAIFSGIYVYSAQQPGLLSKIVTLATALLAAILGYLTYRRQHLESPDFPDVLGRQFGKKQVLETDGIQFLGVLQPGKDASPHFVTIFLQNTYDGPRTVTIRFDAAGQEQYLRFHSQYQSALGPAEIASVTLPVVAPTYAGQYSLYFTLAVAGSEGQRVRLGRATAATERIKGSATAALLVVGHLAVGGGVRFIIGPLAQDLWNIELPAPAAASLWQPRVGTVPLRQSVV